MKKVLITSEYFGKFSNEGEQLLTKAGFQVIQNPYGHKFLSSKEIIPIAGCADAMICDLEKIDSAVLNAAPNLQIISRRGVGYDNIDTSITTKRKIVIGRTVGVIEHGVVELTLALILNLGRRINEMNAEMHEGIWEKRESFGVYEKVLGIAGAGKIGCELARVAHMFGMRIKYYSRTRNHSLEEMYNAEFCSLEQLFQTSDYVSLHMSLNDSTRGLIDKHLFKLMKPSAYFINTARAAIVKEEDLADALKSGLLAGAAIDVFENEPCIDSPLTACQNAIITPHVGTFTIPIFINMDMKAAQNIIDFYKGTLSYNPSTYIM